jgi:hypothetical protein
MIIIMMMLVGLKTSKYNFVIISQLYISIDTEPDTGLVQQEKKKENKECLEWLMKERPDALSETQEGRGSRRTRTRSL